MSSPSKQRKRNLLKPLLILLILTVVTNRVLVVCAFFTVVVCFFSVLLIAEYELSQSQQLRNHYSIQDERIFQQQQRLLALDEAWRSENKDRQEDTKIIVVPYFSLTCDTDDLTAIVKQLESDPSFYWLDLYGDVSSWATWWQHADTSLRTSLRRVCRNKQLEFVTGAWKRTTSVLATSEVWGMNIDIGHEWIRQNLGDACIPSWGYGLDRHVDSIASWNMSGIILDHMPLHVDGSNAFVYRTSQSQALLNVHVWNDPCHSSSNGRPFCLQRVTYASELSSVTDELLQWSKLVLSSTSVVVLPLEIAPRLLSQTVAKVNMLMERIQVSNVEASVRWGTVTAYYNELQNAGGLIKSQYTGPLFAPSVQETNSLFGVRAFERGLLARLFRLLCIAEKLYSKNLDQHQKEYLELLDQVSYTAPDDIAPRINSAIDAIFRSIVSHLSQLFPDNVNTSLKPCNVPRQARSIARNECHGDAIVYNPNDNAHRWCNNAIVPAQSVLSTTADCVDDDNTSEGIVYSKNGWMIEPIAEQWVSVKIAEPLTIDTVSFKPTYHDFHRYHLQVNGNYVTSNNLSRRVQSQKLRVLDTNYIALDFTYRFMTYREDQGWAVEFDLTKFFGGDDNQLKRDNIVTSIALSTHVVEDSVSISTGRRVLLFVAAQPCVLSFSQKGVFQVILDYRSRDDSGIDNTAAAISFRIMMSDDISVDADFARVLAQVQQSYYNPVEAFGVHDDFVQAVTRPIDPDEYERQRNERRARRNQLRGMVSTAMNSESVGVTKNDGLSSVMTANESVTNLRPNAISYIAQVNDQPVRLRKTDMMKSTVREIQSTLHSADTTILPFVFMVSDRVSYLKQAIESLKQSDFPRDKVPIIISHDGHVPKMMQYVESIKSDFIVIQLFHEYSCYDSQSLFPGDEISLNENYKGDIYGNMRDYKVTCCKHHFVWMLQAVFSLFRQYDDLANVDTFFFTEEDYTVSPLIYKSLINGLNAKHMIEEETKSDIFGVCSDPLYGETGSQPMPSDRDTWYVETFTSGPMTMDRRMFDTFQNVSDKYCTIDDYNWDWTFVQLQSIGLLPHSVIMPSRQIVQHVGLSNGMHKHKSLMFEAHQEKTSSMSASPFASTKFAGPDSVDLRSSSVPRLNGGWGHPKDQNHCKHLLENNSNI